MNFEVYESGSLVSLSKSIGGAKRSAIAYSKREKDKLFIVKDPGGRIISKYRNAQEQW